MSQLTQLTSMIRSAGHGETLTSLAKQYNMTEETVAFAVFLKMCQLSQEQSSAPKPLSEERVSETPLKDSDGVKAIPSVATLAQPQSSETLAQPRGVRFDPRLGLTSFKGMTEDNAIGAIDAILNRGRPTPTQVRVIHEYLFSSPERFDKFLKLYGSDADTQNFQFESFLSIMNIDLLNEHNQTWLPIVLGFAFSPVRFEWIQLQNDDIPSSLNEELLQYEASIRSKDIGKDIEGFQRRSSQAFEAWRDIRMEGSTTISNPSSAQRLAKQNWIAADAKMQQKASQGGGVGFGTARVIHRLLTNGEADVNSPGEVRSGVVRSSTALLLYPTPNSDLHAKADSYGRWLNQEVAACERGEKSVILTAAQAYQRLVAIHPFQGGNGRISRFMMDYVLERFGLPPAALGKDVLDAVFALNQKSPTAGEEFVRKVYEGVQTSHKFITR